MSDHKTNVDDDHPRPATSPTEATPRLASEIVRVDDRPPQCTIYPADRAGIDTMTTWITATKGSFVCLDDVR